MDAIVHPIALEEVMAFLDGELSADRARSVSTHIHDCAECSETARLVRDVSGSLANWTLPEMTVEVEKRVLGASSRPKDFPARELISDLGRFLNRRVAIACGAGIAILLVFFGLSSTRFHRASSKIAREQDISVDHAALAASPMVDHAKIPLSEHGRNQIEAEGANSQYYVHRIPLQGQLGSLQSGADLTPMIARAVSLSIVVKDFDAGRASLDAILARHNGYAASLSVSTPQGSGRTLQASLRIQAPQYSAALSELKSLGRVEAEAQNGEEVTQQHADLVARIKNDRETELRLQDILEKRTGKVKDVLEVEQEVARVRGEIEQMEAEQKTLEHRVEFATIDLKLAEEYKAQLNTPAPSVLMQLRNAAVNGFRDAFESLLAVVLFVAESGPSLLLWLAILGVPAWRLWRRYRRAQSLADALGPSTGA